MTDDDFKKIRIKRGTTAEWAAASHILGIGEEGLDTDLMEIRYGDGTSAWADLKPIRANNGAANVIMAVSSLTPATDDLLYTMWYDPGQAAAPDGTPPTPQDFSPLGSFTWSGTYDEPNQRVLLMLPGDEFPSVYAYVTADGFIPIPLLGGQIVTVGCIAAGYGPTPSVWVGYNEADEIGETDPRAAATTFRPISLTSHDVFPDSGVNWTGLFNGRSGNLTSFLQTIDGATSKGQVYEAFLTLGYEFDATTGVSGIALNGQLAPTSGNHVFIPTESHNNIGLYVVADDNQTLTLAVELFDGNHNGSLVWSYNLLASANGKLVSSTYADRFIYGVYTTEDCNVVPLHTPAIVVDAFVLSIGDGGAFSIQNLDGSTSSYNFVDMPALYQFHYSGYLYDVIEGTPTVNWGAFLGSGIVQTVENDATPGCGGIILFVDNASYSLLNAPTYHPIKYICQWYGKISTDSPSAFSDLTVTDLTGATVETPLDQHSQGLLDGQLVAVWEPDNNYVRVGVWQIHDGSPWKKLPTIFNDLIIFDNCGQVAVSTVMLSYSSGEETAQWNPINLNYLEQVVPTLVREVPDPDDADIAQVLAVAQPAIDHTVSVITTANNGAGTLATITGETIASWSDAPNSPSPYPLPTTAAYDAAFDVGIMLGAPTLPDGFTVTSVEIDATIGSSHTITKALLTRGNQSAYPGGGIGDHATGTYTPGGLGDFTLVVTPSPAITIGVDGADDIQVQIGFLNDTEGDSTTVRAVRWIGTVVGPKITEWTDPPARPTVVALDAYAADTFATDGSLELPSGALILTFQGAQSDGKGIYLQHDDSIPHLLYTSQANTLYVTTYDMNGTVAPHFWYLDDYNSQPVDLYPTLPTLSFQDIPSNSSTNVIGGICSGDMSAGDGSANLPDPETQGQGNPISFTNYGTSNNIVINPHSAETIDGQSSVTISPGQSITLQVFPDNNWHTIAVTGG